MYLNTNIKCNKKYIYIIEFWFPIVLLQGLKYNTVNKFLVSRKPTLFTSFKNVIDHSKPELLNRTVREVLCLSIWWFLCLGL